MGKPTLSKNKSKYEKIAHGQKVGLWRNLLVTVEEMKEVLERKLATKDCSYPRFRLLFILYFDAPCSTASLSGRLRVTRSNLSTFLKRLQEDGLIYPCPLVSSDKRPKYILSEKGVKYIEDIMDFHFENIKDLPLFTRPELTRELSSFLDLLKKYKV